ncbi:MAG: hypothetical protein NQ127_00110 [Candidatus Cardinium sp.]|nr:hypothetical protein [Candidatus Cardinium sp.]
MVIIAAIFLWGCNRVDTGMKVRYKSSNTVVIIDTSADNIVQTASRLTHDPLKKALESVKILGEIIDKLLLLRPLMPAQENRFLQKCKRIMHIEGSSKYDLLGVALLGGGAASIAFLNNVASYYLSHSLGVAEPYIAYSMSTVLPATLLTGSFSLIAALGMTQWNRMRNTQKPRLSRKALMKEKEKAEEALAYACNLSKESKEGCSFDLGFIERHAKPAREQMEKLFYNTYKLATETDQDLRSLVPHDVATLKDLLEKLKESLESISEMLQEGEFKHTVENCDYRRSVIKQMFNIA